MTVTTSISSIGTTIESAKETVQIEQRRVTDEIEAYEQFATKLTTISTTSLSHLTSGTFDTTVEQGVTSETRSIQNLFEETVMSVPHYEEDYDESFMKHIAAEFTPEIALLLNETEWLTEQHTSVLNSYIRTAITERKELAQALEVEYESVDHIGNQVHERAQEVLEISHREFNTMDFGALEAHWHRLEQIKTICDSIAADRQETIDSPTRAVACSNSDISMSRYLYQDLAYDYPILATIGILGSSIYALQTQIERLIASVN
ncbi:hypothetical protein HKK80_10695 [Halonotius sp. F2-221B]|uniref:DUF7260 family protein n=1 Tax=Halonotius sp. F2-221B TaxID=2731620 RepID=UPI00398ABA15